MSMRNLIFLSLILLCSSCKKDGGPEGAVINSMLSNTDIADLAAVADVLEEENEFNYQLVQSEILDLQPAAKYVQNLMNESGEQEAFIVSEQANQPLLVQKINIDQAQIDRNEISITGLLQNIRFDGQYVFLTTQKPTHLYVYDYRAKQLVAQHELFPESSLELKKKTISLFNKTLKNTMCGVHSAGAKNLFHYNLSNETLSYINYSGTISSLICLENAILINASNSIYTLLPLGESAEESIKSVSKEELACSVSLTPIVRNNKVFLSCAYKDANNKTRSKIYFVDEEGNQFSPATLPARSVVAALKYVAKLDVVNTNRNESAAMFRYRPITSEVWSEMSVPSYSAPKKILSMDITDNEVRFLTYFSVLKLSNQNLIKYPLAKTPSAFVASEDALVFSDSSVSKVDESRETNDYMLKLLTTQAAASTTSEVNPTPFLSVTDKIAISLVTKSEESADVVASIKKNNVSHLRRVNVAQNAVSDFPLDNGVVIRDLKIFDHKIYSVNYNPDKTHDLMVYDFDFNVLIQKRITYPNVAYSRLTFVSDGLLVMTRKNMHKFDLEFNLIWTKALTGITSERVLELQSGKYLIINAGMITLVDRADGKFQEITSITPINSVVIKDIVLLGQNLYLNYQGSKYAYIKLPYSLLNWSE
jgi:hypothetical protein